VKEAGNYFDAMSKTDAMHKSLSGVSSENKERIEDMLNPNPNLGPNLDPNLDPNPDPNTLTLTLTLTGRPPLRRDLS